MPKFDNCAHLFVHWGKSGIRHFTFRSMTSGRQLPSEQGIEKQKFYECVNPHHAVTAKLEFLRIIMQTTPLVFLYRRIQHIIFKENIWHSHTTMQRTIIRINDSGSHIFNARRCDFLSSSAGRMSSFPVISNFCIILLKVQGNMGLLHINDIWWNSFTAATEFC